MPPGPTLHQRGQNFEDVVIRLVAEGIHVPHRPCVPHGHTGELEWKDPGVLLAPPPQPASGPPRRGFRVPPNGPDAPSEEGIGDHEGQRLMLTTYRWEDACSAAGVRQGSLMSPE